jgi:hypothetical protein
VKGSDSPEDDGKNGAEDESEDEELGNWLVLGSTSLKAVMEAVCKAR